MKFQNFLAIFSSFTLRVEQFSTGERPFHRFTLYPPLPLDFLTNCFGEQKQHLRTRHYTDVLLCLRVQVIVASELAGYKQCSIFNSQSFYCFDSHPSFFSFFLLFFTLVYHIILDFCLSYLKKNQLFKANTKNCITKIHHSVYIWR